MADYEKGARHNVRPDLHKVISPEAKITQREAISKVGDVIVAPLALFKWFADNWQLGIVGLIAIFILLRD